ncbi:hypothetical protein Pan216_30560 [Planctomycetes bacterium Pan216]|uniref:Uncharacterized protein n=1 Tax=Kolteria novifilia TaxID=2527975 RepID=A0A518B5E6_9BACT|nr:hypothetical protein Pan216_30560 [Planctomycetes bacterium Pan216]
MNTSARRPLLFVSLVLLVPACGGTAHPTTYPVSGSVHYKGEPLAVGVITFHPDKGRAAYGTIKGGEILGVTTFRQGDGALPGHHRVVVESTKEDPNDPFSSTSLIPEKYGNPDTSGLEADLSSSRGNTLTYELKD